ncbi:MAG: hypothetical protein JOY64_04390 [Alphaproteobacteria bacterium]|nr:hypothetical protein [Alphaproteobacteria bacterium]MBV8406846.1 hypothetical protein [Alphaproteobacteria bacterium]
MSDNTTTDDKIALRGAINALRGTLESRRVPSGLPLERDTAEHMSVPYCCFGLAWIPRLRSG